MFCRMWFLCCAVWVVVCLFFFFKQKTAYEMRISDWSADVCSSDLGVERGTEPARLVTRQPLFASRPVAEFVQGSPVKVDLMGKGRLRRHLHIVAANIIERPRSADAEICTRGGNQRFRAVMLFAGR